MNILAPFTTEIYQPRADLKLSSWIRRDLPLRDYLLGNVLCTTSRWIIYGETGIGKTLIAADMAGAMAAGSSMLNWIGRRPARTMYLDGEMPAETFKERMQLVADRYRADLPFWGYNREVLPDGAMPPLNTPEGEKWLWAEIDLIKPDVIIFDSIMCLLAGSMSEEESWAPVKALIRKISSRRIAQIWLHHSGHDNSKGFGTKTREWEMDTVVSLTKPTPESDGKQIALEFKKARLRTPETFEQFAPRLIHLDSDGWTSDGAGPAKAKGTSAERDLVRKAILSAYDRLAGSVTTSPGFDGAPVLKVDVDAVRDEVKSRGFLEKKETGGLTERARQLFQRAKADVLSAKTHIEADGAFWKLAPNRHPSP